MLDSIDIQGMLSSPPYTPHPTTPFPDTGSTLAIVYSSLTTKQLENETLVMCTKVVRPGQKIVKKKMVHWMLMLVNMMV